jgi:hypothetical protein
MRCVFGSSDGWPHRLTHGSELRRALDTVARSPRHFRPVAANRRHSRGNLQGAGGGWEPVVRDNPVDPWCDGIAVDG